MPRGLKTCENCGYQTGPRAFKCPKCGANYVVRRGITKRRRKRAGEKIDWRTLRDGDFIKVLRRGGPYWTLENGEQEPMGYFGYFQVAGIDGEGIKAYPADRHNSGYCYIYMGKERRSPAGTTLAPHRVRKVDPQFILRKVG